jgi:hypothetical protein
MSLDAECEARRCGFGGKLDAFLTRRLALTRQTRVAKTSADPSGVAPLRRTGQIIQLGYIPDLPVMVVFEVDGVMARFSIVMVIAANPHPVRFLRLG